MWGAVKGLNVSEHTHINLFYPHTELFRASLIFKQALRGDVIVQIETFRGKLRDHPLRKRRFVFIFGAQYRQDGAVRTNVVLFWGSGHKEPWYLVTSLSDPKLAVEMYRRRM